MANLSRDILETNCFICGARDWSVLYNGIIRIGKFGNWSTKEYTVWRCNKCGAGYLNQPKLDYESSEYRDLVDSDSSPEAFYRNHDKDQALNLRILGTDNLRGKIIADIGCGGGSFLDLVRGYTQQTIAVEPAFSYRHVLLQKGHLCYPYCQNALNDWQGKVDIAVSFAVIEHVENPVHFLREIRGLLKPNGKLLLSTPNYDDWLLEFLPDVYGRFFYRRVHRWYFNGNSLKELASVTGFSRVEIMFVQRFDLSNALMWIRDHRPTGLGNNPILQDLDGCYKKALEKRGHSDFIYAWLIM